MKRYLFIADDNEIPDLENLNAEALAAGFHSTRPYAHLDNETKQKLIAESDKLAQEGGLVYLITDAHFTFEVESELGGDNLGRSFLERRNQECRVVIRSEEPKRDPHRPLDPRVCAVKRNTSPAQMLSFLLSGHMVQIYECLAFLRRIAAFRHVFELSSDQPQEIIDMTVDALAEGFGLNSVEPFRERSLPLFDQAVADYLRKPITIASWDATVAILHPYNTLEHVASDRFSLGNPPGNFMVLWLLCKHKKQPSLIANDLEADELHFAPREQAWVRRNRLSLRNKLTELFPANAPADRWIALFRATHGELGRIEDLLLLLEEVGDG